MKKAFALIYLFLLFTACSHKQAVEPISAAGSDPTPMIIDHPAVVVFKQHIPDVKEGKKSNESIEKILKSFHIPVITSGVENIEFVKNNGDRIRLDIKTLSSNYDLILFNAVNDPMPCFLKDLLKSAKNCFPSGRQHEPTNNRPDKHLLATPEIQHDSNNVNAGAKYYTHSSLKGKTLRFIIPDTSDIPLSLRNNKGIRWIEQRIDTRCFLNVKFENDLITYSNTDRYFTNGISLSLQTRWLSTSRLTTLMLPYRHPAIVSYSLELTQNMYTPKDTRIAPTFNDDRPYASYLHLSYRKVTNDPNRHIRLTNDFILGYLGPYSPGAYMQTLVHETFPSNDKPMGWESQIKTDIILNYNLKAEKSLINRPTFVLAATALAQAGTLYSKTGLGFRLQAGRQEPYFGISPGTCQSNWQFYCFLDAGSQFIAYDATLQGGALNRNNTFSLNYNEISHFVGNAVAGIQFSYKGTGIELAQHYLSPEYKGGLWHKWGSINLIFKL